MRLRSILVSAVLLAACTLASAHDFAVAIDGQRVYFNIKSSKNKTAEVTYEGSIADGKPSYFEGELVIPEKVRHNNVVYSVVGIGPKAFSGADKLTGIVLPSGIVSIGDFAFEGCISLEKIVFPGNEVRFGQGVFFKCDKIRSVTLGSDWKEVDLQMFRWSDTLQELHFPAKIARIRNMKSLKGLVRVSVDANNDRFSAVDGMLYDKGGETLYGCPRSYEGVARVAEGTRTLTPGAMADCNLVTRVDLPESLASLSFREFSRMAGLEEIVFRAAEPLMTAQRGGEEVFLLQLEVPNVRIVVLRSARDDYQAALVQQAGEYAEIGGTTPYLVERSRMPEAKNVIGVRNFTKYE